MVQPTGSERRRAAEGQASSPAPPLIAPLAARPLVSCLCVSRPEHWGQLQRAVANFDTQTYADRELIIVTDRKRDYASMIEDYLAHALEHPLKAPVRVFGRPLHGQLDGLIYAMCQARGDYFAVWDDDNQDHPTRLSVQVEYQARFPGSLTAFGESMYYFHGSDELFVVAYERPDAKASERCAVSTLMGPRDVFPAVEPQFRARPVEMLVNSLHRNGGRLVVIPGRPFLHAVGVTHDNLRGYELHRFLAQDRGRKADWLVANRQALTDALDGYSWDVPSVDVVGGDASAFKYEVKWRCPDTLFPVRVKDDSVEERVELLPEDK